MSGTPSNFLDHRTLVAVTLPLPSGRMAEAALYSTATEPPFGKNRGGTHVLFEAIRPPDFLAIRKAVGNDQGSPQVITCSDLNLDDNGGGPGTGDGAPCLPHGFPRGRVQGIKAR